MPRSRRKKSVSNFYHIIIRGINKENIFQTDRHKEKMIKFLRENEKEDIEIYAYCIMSNHMHLLLKGALKKISSYMHSVETSYALYYNRKMERCGYVFQSRFKSFPIESEEYLWQCFYYIHMNPVKAKITGQMQRYKYSSAQEYLYGKKRLIGEKARSLFRNNQMFYAAEKIISQLEEVYIEDLPEEVVEQKERIVKRWIDIYLTEHPDLSLWDLKNLPKYRNDFIDIMLDPHIMSRKELNRRIEKF